MFDYLNSGIFTVGIEKQLIGGGGYLLTFMDSFFIVAVNIYFLISGYFTINFKFDKFWKVFGIVEFYSITIYSILVLTGNELFELRTFIEYSVLAVHEYWFVVVYLVLILIAPYLNLLLERIKEDKNIFIKMLLVLFCIDCIYGFIFDEIPSIGINGGNSVAYAVFLYFIGFFIKEYNLANRISARYIVLGYILCCLINWSFMALFIMEGKGNYAWKLLCYNNPIVVIASVALLITFLKWKSIGRLGKLIAEVGPYTFGVYIIHCFPLLKEYRFKILKQLLEERALVLWPFFIMGYCLILYIVCLIIDKVRKQSVKNIGIYIYRVKRFKEGRMNEK